MTIEPLPPESEIPASFRTNPLLNYAFRIKRGEAGGLYVYCLEEDDFYIYEEGIWRKIYEVEFLANLSKSIPEITRFTLPLRKQILENYKVLNFKALKDFNSFDLLTLQNGVVNPNDGSFRAHDEMFFSTFKLEYEYKIEAGCPLWIKSLEEIFEDDQLRIGLLQEFFGYCLVPDVEQKKALLLLGDSDTGKSTILFTLRDLIGPSNCSSVPLKYLANPQYTPMMVNKLVNIDADVDKNAANYEAEFKMVTTGEPINCNQKFVETFQFIPKCKIVLAANIFPKITDHSSAFYKRLILIPCDRIFEESEKNRFLNKQLKAELPGILNWAIVGLRNLKDRGMFQQHDFMKEAVQELEDENNPVNIFFNEHVEVDMTEGAYIEKAELFDHYKQWCGANDKYHLNPIRFARSVLKKFHQVTPKQARLNHGKRAYIWKHVQYVHSKSISGTEVTWQEKNDG